MEKREPSLAPEWYKSSGHGSGVGSSNHLLSSSNSHSHSDSSAVLRNSKNTNSRSRSNADPVRSPFLDRSSSTNTRRGSSNGSTKHAYSSFNFNRSNRDKDRSREKDRLSYIDDPWDIDPSVPFGSLLIGRGSEPLRRSHSMTTRSSKRTGFDKDFPLLKADERNGGPDGVRISSPGLSPTVQSSPVGKPALIVGEGWTSALAEVPSFIEKRGTVSHANIGSSATSTTPTCLNMAEALVQTPARTGTPPQAQSLEDRAIRQSRQLVPVVSSAPKGSIHNSSDKSKTKSMFRSGEAGLASSRSTQQQSSVVLGNLQSNPGSQVKPDTAKKLVVLKPASARENEVGAGVSPTNNRAATSHLTTSPSTQFASSVTSTNGSSTVNMIAGKPAEKKPYLVQTQSRNAFYSDLKQKKSANISTDPTKTSSCISPSVEEKSNSSNELVAGDPSNGQGIARDDDMERVEKVSDVAEVNSRFESAVRPDPEEAEFLKSLGWDENNTEEDVPIQEEEIRAWIEQYKDLKPSLVQKLQIVEKATEDKAPNS